LLRSYTPVRSAYLIFSGSVCNVRADRTEVAIVALVVAAAGLILVAPLLGRVGAPGWADMAMGLASGAGIGAFILVAVHTFRAAMRRGEGGEGGKL
jgi:hypothetical protein